VKEGQKDEERNDPRNVTEWSSREEEKRDQTDGKKLTSFDSIASHSTLLRRVEGWEEYYTRRTH
jgi:hypothetical protein